MCALESSLFMKELSNVVDNFELKFEWQNFSKRSHVFCGLMRQDELIRYKILMKINRKRKGGIEFIYLGQSHDG